jgi:hypothetical protein
VVVFGSGVRELAHAKVVDDQERHHRELSEVRAPCADEGRLGEFLEQRVGFAIDDALALQDGGAADRLR